MRGTEEENLRRRDLLPDAVREARQGRPDRDDRAVRRQGREEPALVRLHPGDARAEAVQLLGAHRAQRFAPRVLPPPV